MKELPARTLPSVVLAGLCALAACDACRGRGEQVARLANTFGTVQRDFAAQAGRWQPVAVGAAFQVGDGLRTAAAARAELDLVPSGRLRVEAATVVRFARTPPGRSADGRVELEAGAIELEAADRELEVTSVRGQARLAPGTVMRVRTDRSQVAFAVEVGSVLVEEQGGTRELRAGDSFVLEIGTLDIDPAPAAAAAPQSVEPAPAAAAGEQAVAFDTPPSRADFELPAGESATVHDPAPPTHVRIAYAGCPELAIVEVERMNGAHLTRVQGDGGGIAALPTGQFRYRVGCEAGAPRGRSAAEGRLQIVRDAATRRLKTAPPAVKVATDGRRYTVRYQNLLPQLSVHWPGAPAAASYVLELRAGDRSLLRERSASPVVTLASGRIEEGTYGFRFEAAGTRSPESTLSILFDDAARVAHLSEPRERGFAAGAMVRVAGAALRGAQVLVEGKRLPAHPQGRFDTRVLAPVVHSALSVRVQHAASGVHYFLRHAADPGE